MLRLRLASLALACGFLTLSGCCAFCEDGKLFPRLFRSNYQSRPILDRIHGVNGVPGAHGDCECMHGTNMPPIHEFSGGPVITMPQAGVQSTPIPITTFPASQPPILQKFPQAAPTPYYPGN